jgi:hypothetical protein
VVFIAVAQTTFRGFAAVGDASGTGALRGRLERERREVSRLRREGGALRPRLGAARRLAGRS